MIHILVAAALQVEQLLSYLAFLSRRGYFSGLWLYPPAQTDPPHTHKCQVLLMEIEMSYVS